MTIQNGWTKKFKEMEEQIAALEKKVDEFDKEICRWASRAKVAEKQIVALTAENKRLKEGRDAVYDLIAQSHGVAGLHLNGDIAPWDELLEDGRFEEWLLPFSKSLKAQEVLRGGEVKE